MLLGGGLLPVGEQAGPGYETQRSSAGRSSDTCVTGSSCACAGGWPRPRPGWHDGDTMPSVECRQHLPTMLRRCHACCPVPHAVQQKPHSNAACMAQCCAQLQRPCHSLGANLLFCAQGTFTFESGMEPDLGTQEAVSGPL